MLSLECAMDELAEKLGLDPIELRIRNEPEIDPETGVVKDMLEPQQDNASVWAAVMRKPCEGGK